MSDTIKYVQELLELVSLYMYIIQYTVCTLYITNMHKTLASVNRVEYRLWKAFRPVVPDIWLLNGFLLALRILKAAARF